MENEIVYEKTTVFAGLIWVAGMLAMILFQDVFTGSRLGLALGLLLALVILAATYFVLDGMIKIRRRQQELEGLRKQAYEDKLLEILQDELQKREGTINDMTMQAAKLLVKYTNKTSRETLQKLDELEQELRK